MKLKPSLIKWLGQIEGVEKVDVWFKSLEIDSSDLEGTGMISELSKENDQFAYKIYRAGKGMKFRFAKIKLDIKVD